MATLRHWGEAAYSGPYELRLFRSQYLLYHLAGAGLTALVGDAALANRLLCALAGIGWPLAFRVLLRAAGRDERTAIFACLPFWSRPLVLGFLPFVASVPIALLALASVFRFVRRPTRGSGAAIVALSIVLFYAHVSSWSLFVAATFAVAIVARRWRVLLAIVPSGAAAVVWFALGKLTLGAGSITDPGEVTRLSIRRSIFAMPVWIFDVWRSHGDEIAAAAWWCAFLATVLLGARALGRYPRAALARLYAPFLAVLAIYLLTPWRIGAAVMLNVRLAPVLVLFALLPTRLPRRGRGPLIVLGLVLIANVVGGITALRECRRATADLGDLDRVLAVMRPGSRVITLNFDVASSVTHIFPWAHVAAYHRVRGGGVAEFSFSELKHWPVQYRAGERPPQKVGATWDVDPCSFRNATDGAYYDFVLVRGAVDPFADEPPGPVFERVLTTGALTLFQKRTDTWPLRTEPDRGPCRREPTPPR